MNPAINVLASGESVAVAAGGETFATEKLSVWGEAVLLVELASTGSISVAVTMEVSHDGSTWFTTTVHDLTASAARNVQVASKTLTANTKAALLALRNYAPYVRAKFVNAGDAAATISAVLITR